MRFRAELGESGTLLAMSVCMNRNSKQIENSAARIARLIADTLAAAPGAIVSIRSLANGSR